MAMNWIRGLLGGRRSASGQNGISSPGPPPRDALGAIHLRRLFIEYYNMPPDDREAKEGHLVKMLPVFCQVFGTTRPSEIVERFAEATIFARDVSQLLVAEIRRHAVHPQTQVASDQLARFLENRADEGAPSTGWNMLNTVNLLVACGGSVSDTMAGTDLPSTFVKSLYLFLDLPPTSGILYESGGDDGDGTNVDQRRRDDLHKLFSQALTRMCQQLSAAENIMRQDDLSKLFGIVTSSCPPHNQSWRKTASDSLIKITRHCLTPDLIGHIHNHGCISLCVRNLSARDLRPLEVVEMFVAVFSCLKDSSEITFLLLDDFRTASGYRFLTDFLLALESDVHVEESREAMRNMVLLISSLVMCGFTEMRPSVSGGQQPFQDRDFRIPDVSDQVLGVKNILAFQVLEAAFLKARTADLCGVILDVIFNVYSSDQANYFILEQQHTLPHFIEKVSTKSIKIQEQVFKVLEYVVCSLNYVPFPELVSISILLKAKTNSKTLCVVMQTLVKFISFHAKYQDVYREMGIMDALIYNLQNYAASLKEGTEGDDPQDGAEEEFIFLLMECLRIILESNPQNGALFRESGGARCVLNMIPFARSRREALKLVQQLVLLPEGQDDMGTLLELMHSAEATAVKLKSDVLRAVLRLFNLASRTKAIFRQTDGFIYIVSVLSSIEGSLKPNNQTWENVDRDDVVQLLRSAFSVLTTAMQDEPCNRKYFMENVNYYGLLKPLSFLGCFVEGRDALPSVAESDVFRRAAANRHSTSDDASENATKFQSSAVNGASEVFRCLRDMAVDSFDDKLPSVYPHGDETKHKSSRLVHPHALLVMIGLLPAVEGAPTRDDYEKMSREDKDLNNKWAFGLQHAVLNSIEYLIGSDRNAQMVFQAGMTTTVLQKCNSALADELHPLHHQLQRLFERLASYALTPANVREFLRLGDPLNCRVDKLVSVALEHRASLDEIDLAHVSPNLGKPVDFTRIQSLVSITTPRDGGFHGPHSTPSFVEFDMTCEGYGYLYVPSITPIATSSTSSSSSSTTGAFERLFPPTSGLTYAAWICVEKMGIVGDPHPIRLLTIVRLVETVENKTKRQHCFSISVAGGKLFVTTNEGGGDVSDESKSSNQATFSIDKGITEGHWRHVVVVLSRGMILRNSSVALYLDGQYVDSKKISYIASGSGGVATEETSAPSSPTSLSMSSNGNAVSAYVGTRTGQRRISRLVWRLGPTHLMEESISASTVLCLYLLGPCYKGSFQAPCIESAGAKLQQFEDAEFLSSPGSSGVVGVGELLGSLVGEEKLIFGIDASAYSDVTFKDVHHFFSEMDANATRKELNITRNDLGWPVTLLSNTVVHLLGPARPYGAALVGRAGVRTFEPRPVSKMLNCVGGTSVMLGLVGMANNVDSLYAAVKATVCVLKGNTMALREMERMGGFQILALLLKMKHHLLNSHILHLTFSLVGTVDSDHECARIPYVTAFRDLLGNLEAWSDAPQEIQRSLYDHLYELAYRSNDHRTNAEQLCDMQMVRRLLHLLNRDALTDQTVEKIGKVVSALLEEIHNDADILCFGQFLSSLLPPKGIDERQVECDDIDGVPGSVFALPDTPLGRRIQLRNRLLDVVNILLQDSSLQLRPKMVTQLLHVLGCDWFLSFMARNVHPSTVLLAFRLLAVVLTRRNFLVDFADGTPSGGWLTGSVATLTRVSSPTSPSPQKTSVSLATATPSVSITVPGFQALSHLLAYHASCPPLFFVLFAILLGRPIEEIPLTTALSVDNLHRVLRVPHVVSTTFSRRGSNSERLEGIHLCSDAVFVFLFMLRALLSESCSEEDGESKRETPSIVLKFLMSASQLVPELGDLCHKKPFIEGLVATLFPLQASEQFDVIETDGVPSTAPETTLTCHRARQTVFDVLKSIVTDGLRFIQPSRSSYPLLEFALEGSPDGSTQGQQAEFQTMFLLNVIDHLVVAEVLTPESKLRDGSGAARLVSGVAVIFSRIADRLWNGTFKRNQNAVLTSLMEIMEQSKSNYQSVNLDDLFRPLNRIVLCQLSRSCRTISEQTSILLDTLHTITKHHKLIFNSSNFDPGFLACLCHCLGCLATGNPVTQQENSDDDLSTTNSSITTIRSGSELIQGSASRVWDILLESKSAELQEVFKWDITNVRRQSVPFGLRTDPSLGIKNLLPLFANQAQKSWNDYEGMERQRIESTASAEQSKLKNLISMVRWSSTKKEPSRISVPAQLQEYLDHGFFVHLEQVQQTVEVQRIKFQRNTIELFRYTASQWSKIETELSRERGLWGPMNPSPLNKWTLDKTEGPYRKRMKLELNTKFYEDFPHTVEKPEVQTKYQPPKCHDSALHHWLSRSGQKQLLAEKFDSSTQEERNRVAFQVGQPLALTTFNWDAVSVATTSDSGVSSDVPDGEDATGSQDYVDVFGEPIQQRLSHMFEDGEHIRLKFLCARVEGLDVIQGVFFFGKQNLYIVDAITILPTGEIADLETVPPESKPQIIPIQEHRSSKAMEPTSYAIKCHKFFYGDIVDLHKRRYLLMDIALELFAGDGRNHFIAFRKGDRNKIYDRLLKICRVLSETSDSKISGMKREGEVEASSGLIRGLFGDKTLTQKWERGEMTNFQYLMCLNTLAGRSYNDLMQYPIFPWVVKDFDTEELDLTNPDTFRDLSKPMGAQTPDRLRQFITKFENWEDTTGQNTPAYYYGTHYSSAMIVASYLIRMEPFTHHFLRLQGGHFDIADRLFHSIKDYWKSASEINSTDVKELIPEFFYLPEFLSNANNFDLGKKQSGVVIGDVVLPPWAKGDPAEFIRLHREALECDYVSAHLHEWIDLVFGYRQQGQAAVEAHNVFHHLFYEGAVDIDKIEDPLDRNATIGFINNFGQMPKQLFKKPHPARKIKSSGGDAAADKIFYRHVRSLLPTLQPIKEVRGPVGQIVQSEKGIVAVERNKVLVPPYFSRFLAWGFPDHSVRGGNLETERINSVYEGLHYGPIKCAVCPDARTLITAGESTVICVWQLVPSNIKEKGRLLQQKQTLYGHTAPVTALAASPAYSVLVSGSEDCTCIVWDLNKLVFVRQLSGHCSSITAISINNLTGNIATCAANTIYLWTINGKPIAETVVAEGHRSAIQCCTVSELYEWDKDNVIVTGSADGIVRMYSCRFVPDSDEVSKQQQAELQQKKIVRRQSASPSRESDSESDVRGSRESILDPEKGTNPFLKPFPPTPVMKWRQRLEFRGKLTSHTAYARTDNKNPAGICCLVVSRDHKSLYVGDEKGRVYQWTVEAPGKRADHWVPDSTIQNCPVCNVSFSLTERRHHCRKCGRIFCGKCSNWFAEIPELSIHSPTRVCQQCYGELQKR